MKENRLRDLKRNTELLILAEILESPTTRLKDIGEELDITVQAVSQYIAAMRKEGLLTERAGRLRPTRKGMQILQEHFTKLKHEVDTILRSIAVVDTCVAIAGKPISKGQALGLVMEDGMLIAYPNAKSSSKGVALESADEGDDVHVGQLEGIVDMELGELLLIEAPSEKEGGSKKADPDRVRERVDSLSPGLIAAGDTVGAALLSKSTEELFVVHAPIESAMSALSKGVDVVFCGTRESIDRMLDAVSVLKKETGYAVRWKSYRA